MAEGDQYLGAFKRYVALFTVYRTIAGEYRVEVDDGAGPRECVRLFKDATIAPRWQGRWSGDEWCAWIVTEARKVILEPSGPAALDGP